MSSFVPRAVASTLAEPDPTKHVKYTLGMVLGVDDFTQEFAYLNGRDQWLARDLFGYGTVSGLEVNIEVEGTTPQVLVTPGVAVSPRGQLIRVAPAQCADLDAWVTSHREELARRVGEVKTNAAETRLCVTVCYRACSTDMVPIPGEPCRSADETLAPSRVTDDFKLELRFDAPAQREEDALRDYADWLGQIEITNESGASPKPREFEEIIRKAVRTENSKEPGGGFMTGPPPEGLKIEARSAARYLRAALNLWVTELRPRVQSWRPDIGRGLDAQSANRPEECVLLAEVRVPLTRATATAVWRVGDAKGIEVIEDRRPCVAHLRMLQELLLNAGRPVKPQPPAYQTVAAGMVKGVEGSGGNEFNNLRVTKTGAGFVSMTFDGYEQPDTDRAPFQYIVKALLVLPSGSTLTQPSVTFSRFEAADTGFTLAVTNAGKAVDKAALANLSFMVEVSRYATSGKENKESKEKDTKETKDTKESKDSKDSKEKDTKESKEKDTKETKEKDTKETKEKDTKETKEKDTKETKEKDTKEGKEKDTKETKEKVDKESEKVAKEGKEAEKAAKEKDTKETKEKAKDTKEVEKAAKETKEKDTKEGKEKDTKETKEKDTKETKEKAKEKDTKETKEKDTKETKEKDTKETKEKDTKETKEKDTKETKEKDTKETREKVKDADKLKDAAALKELERSEMKRPDGPAFGAAAEDAGVTPAAGRAFIREDERPEVGRKALELADEPADDDKPKDVGKPVDAGKAGEASGKQAEAIN